MARFHGRHVLFSHGALDEEFVGPPGACQGRVGTRPFADQMGTILAGRVLRRMVVREERPERGVPDLALRDEAVGLSGQDQSAHPVGPVCGQGGRQLVAGVHAEDVDLFETESIDEIDQASGHGWNRRGVRQGMRVAEARRIYGKHACMGGQERLETVEEPVAARCFAQQEQWKTLPGFGVVNLAVPGGLIRGLDRGHREASLLGTGRRHAFGKQVVLFRSFFPTAILKDT